MTEILTTIGLTLLVFTAVSVAGHGALWLRDQRTWTDISNSKAPHGAGKSVRLLLPPSSDYSIVHRGNKFRGVSADGTLLPVREHVGEAVGDCWAHFGEQASTGLRTISATGTSGSTRAADVGTLHTA